MCSNALNSRGRPEVSPMSGSSVSVIEKKTRKGEFITPPLCLCELSGYVLHLGKEICIDMYFFRASSCEQNVLLYIVIDGEVLSCNFTFGRSVSNQKIQF